VYTAAIETDPAKPDGTPRKLMDVSQLFNTGWRPKYNLPSGLAQTYVWYCQHIDMSQIRGAATA
jgi:GDP-L-fucose synthase